MEEQIISKEELIELFKKEKILDTKKGWFMDKKEVQIIALHDIEPKFIQDVTNAKYYKIVIKRKKL